jgi:hypothetical protein
VPWAAQPGGIDILPSVNGGDSYEGRWPFRWVPVADPLLRGSLGRRSGLAQPLVCCTQTWYHLARTWFSFLREVSNTRRASLAALYIPALNGGAFRAVRVKPPSGTEKFGRLDTGKASEDKSASTLSLTFNQARLKDGKTLPGKTTLVGFSPAGSSDMLPDSVAPDGAFDQEPGAIGAVAIDSEVQQKVSGTLTDAHHNFRLGQGTQLMVAVGVPGQSAVLGNERIALTPEP